MPARTEIVIIADMTHRNKKYFPNPNEFDPERWNTAKDELKKHPYAYIPFSAGSRLVKCFVRAHNDLSVINSLSLQNVELSENLIMIYRNCIGQKFALMEMKTLLSTVLRNFEISTEVPFETFDAAREPEIVLRPGDGVLIKIKKRSMA